MSEKITRESARGQKLIFFPKTHEECVHLQESLFAMGLRWGNGQKAAQYIGECVNGGLVLMDDAIYYRGSGDSSSYTPCAIEQIAPDYVPADQRLMVELFNKLSAKVDALAEKVDRLYDELHPDIGKAKAGLRPPERSGPPPQGGLT